MNITTFAETVLCTLAFCITSLCVPTSEMHIAPSGIFLEAECDGITFGTLALGAPGYEAHERGHMIQHQEMGIFYWVIVAVPSLISAATEIPREHKQRWYEVQATEYGNELYN